jgi:hypothetical protein
MPGEASRISLLKGGLLPDAGCGMILLKNREALEAPACRCSEQVKSHFEEVLRGPSD